MLRTPEDVKRNFDSRRSLVQQIALNQSMVAEYLVQDPANMLNVCSYRLAEALFELYTEQKEYDEYLDRNYITPVLTKKKLWQKLLGK